MAAKPINKDTSYVFPTLDLLKLDMSVLGKSVIGIEAPNNTTDMVSFREIVDCEDVRKNPSKLCVGLGKDIGGKVITIDLAKMPHLLVAGASGSEKTVWLNTLLTGIMYKARPDEVKMILVDTNVAALTNYNGIPHLLSPVLTDAKKAASALRWAVAEMERRYKTFAAFHVRDIKTYNAQAEEKMPYIVIVIDEMSDLMMVAKADVEDAILRLAQKARACGIHMVLATQRPSVDVITGIVKANIPSRIAFAVSSLTDSRTILDMGGAEKLLGKGDMLFYPIGVNKPFRVQGAFVSDEELKRVTDFVKQQAIPIEDNPEITNTALPSDSQKESKNAAAGDGETPEDNGQDELLADAIRLVLDLEQASASVLQRRFRIGYNRAERLLETMEELGIVGSAIGSKPRELLMSRKEVEYKFLHSDNLLELNHTDIIMNGVGEMYYRLGLLYEKGEGVPHDMKKAIQMYEEAVKNESAKAHYRLGLLYYYGIGVDQDKELGMKYIKRAAILGNSEAQDFIKE